MSSVSKVNCTYSTKRPAELAEFGFDGMNIVGHKFNYINAFTGFFSSKIFSCQFKSSGYVDVIGIFIV